MADRSRLDEPEPDEAPYLDATPPHWAARGLAWVLIVLAIGAGATAVLVHVPESVSSPFVLVPVQGGDPVRAPRPGTVVEVRASEGAAVPKGQPLFVLRSETIGDQSAELRALETQLEGARESLTNARAKHESQRSAHAEEGRRLAERRDNLAQKLESHRQARAIRLARYEASLRIAEAEVASARAEIEFKTQHLALAKELAERHKWGYEHGFLSWVEYIRPQIEATKTALDLEQLERQLAVAQLKVTQLRADHESQEVEWRATQEQLETDQREVRGAVEKLRHETDVRRTEFVEVERRLREEMDKARIRMATLRDALVEARGNQLTLRAPCGGSVLRLLVKAPGAVVQDGEVLSELACAGERLQAELHLPAAGMGRILPGQSVKLLYDAFPYERYGVRWGTVRWVSPASLTAKDATGFRAPAEIGDEAVLVDGRPRALVAGMGGRAEIVVGRRSLLSYAFAPLRQLQETLAGPPAK